MIEKAISEKRNSAPRLTADFLHNLMNLAAIRKYDELSIPFPALPKTTPPTV